MSSTEWNFKESFNPNYFEDITDFVSEKIKAIKLYKSELKPYPHPRSIKSIKSLSIYRGVQSGFKNAEAFEIIKIAK